MIGRVVMTLPPHLAVIVMPGPPEVGPPEAGEPEARPHLSAGIAVYASAPPPAVMAGLSAAEQLFVAGWIARTTPKVRPGEGLSWDAPGFVPPDVPGTPGRA